MIISSFKMAAKGKKADCHLRLVQIKLRKNVCKSLWTKCASISNYLIHVMLSYLLDPLQENMPCRAKNSNVRFWYCPDALTLAFHDDVIGFSLTRSVLYTLTIAYIAIAFVNVE